MPFWKTDLTGRALIIPRAAWEDQHAASLECAFPMDEGPSNRHGFVSGAPNTDVTVTAVPAPTLVTGQNARFYGSCCSFTSSGLTVTFVDRSLFGAPNSNFTMETWVRVAETGDGALFTLGNVSVAIVGSTIVLCGDTSAAFTRVVWAHVAVVRNGSTTVTLFVNGVPVCTSSPVIAAAISTVAAFGVACLASDMRVYSTAKYAANFASSFVPTVVPASDITRTTNGTTVSIGITPSTYRTMRVYAGFADPADPAGPGTEVAFSERAAVYTAPSGITCTFGSPVYTLTGTSVSVTTTGFTATAPGSVTIFASKTSGDTEPAAVSDRTALSATGAATVLFSFPTAGTWYVYTRFTNADGLFAGSLVSHASVSVTDYVFPKVAATTTTPVPSQMVAGTPVQCTVTLVGSNYTGLSASNLTIAIGTVSATGLTYVPSTGIATFTLTCPTTGVQDVTLVITQPSSTVVSPKVVVRAVLVDGAAGFTYPTSVAVSPSRLIAGASTSVTVTPNPVVTQSLQCLVYIGATSAEALATPAIAATLSSGAATVTVPGRSGSGPQVYLFARVVTPSGVTGPAVRSAAVAGEAPAFITSGNVLLLDAGNASSYPGTGTTWTDLSGRGHTGTLLNGLTYSSANGGYLIFDGNFHNGQPKDPHVRGNISASYFTGAHTVSCWFNRGNTNDYHALFSNNTETTGCSMLSFFGSSSNLGTQLSSQAAVSVDLGADHRGKWIYATIVYSGATINSALAIYAYKDGELLTATGSLYWNLSTNSSYYIGRWNMNSYYFHGYIAQVAVYNRALTAAEVDQNYNSLKGRFGF